MPVSAGPPSRDGDRRGWAPASVAAARARPGAGAGGRRGVSRPRPGLYKMVKLRTLLLSYPHTLESYAGTREERDGRDRLRYAARNLQRRPSPYQSIL